MAGTKCLLIPYGPGTADILEKEASGPGLGGAFLLPRRLEPQGLVRELEVAPAGPISAALSECQRFTGSHRLLKDFVEEDTLKMQILGAALQRYRFRALLSTCYLSQHSSFAPCS